MSFDKGNIRVDPSVRQLPRIKEVLKRAADSRNYRLKANQYHSDLETSQKLNEIAAEKVYTSARLKQETLDLQIELLRRVEDEKTVLKKDVEQLEKMEKKLARYKKRCYIEMMEKENSKRSKNKSKGFMFDPSNNGDPLSDEYWYRPVKVEPRPTGIKLDYNLIYPNAKKPGLYREMFHVLYSKEISRINEKSLHRLKEKYGSDDHYESKENFLQTPIIMEEEDRRHDNVSRIDSKPFVTQLEYFSTSGNYQREDLAHSPKHQSVTTQTVGDQQESVPPPDTAAVNQVIDLQNKIAQRSKERILSQIEESTQILESWKNALPPSKITVEKLDHCRVKIIRKKKVKRKKQSAIRDVSPNSNINLTPNHPPLSESRTSLLLQTVEATNAHFDESASSDEENSPHFPIQQRVEVNTIATSAATESRRKSSQVSTTTHTVNLSRRQTITRTKPGPALTVPHFELSPILSREATTIMDSKEEQSVKQSSSDKDTHITENSEHLQPNTLTRKKSLNSNISSMDGSVKTRRRSNATSRNPNYEVDWENDPGQQIEDGAVEPHEWSEVVQCRYLRGYEPPEMLLPDNESVYEFVFDRKPSKASISSLISSN